MSPDLISIPVYFLMLAALLCWFIIWAKGNWKLKVLVMSVVMYSSILLWGSISSLGGWPTEKTPPDKFRILNVHIIEKNRKTGKPGAIYVLLIDRIKDAKTEIERKKMDNNEPRLFKINYDRYLHEQLKEVQRRLNKGEIVEGSFKEMKDGEGGSSGLQKKQGKEGPGYKSHSDSPIYRFYNLPKPRGVPKKG